MACRLFGVRLVSDIHERACDLGLPLPAGRGRRDRIDRIEAAGLLFIHIPKAAGMSISQALYGTQVKHLSIRLGRRMEGGRLARLPSFAVLRDPAARFLSAYRYGLAGGSAINQVAENFRALYRGFRSVDEALDHVEQARSPYAVDHIYRPQSWYVTDARGRIAVDQLLTLDDLPDLPRLVPGFPNRVLPCLNRSRPMDLPLSARQLARLRTLYADDFALWERVTPGTAEWPATLPPIRTGATLVPG
ncbi:sulfotransferase family 2 domain-containing protein [Sphingomonas oligoaromativorans]|jgi:hypothetical protein|uniref:sulfotransferase family 2 domain-containing protein n=1 Tax=Sphingomonas oligoaromativorans TaxID=575322 RepID=UPI001ABB997F|nr:sulfotransferase family 2 domain-containing protein [Sphingomonas oligoaromativorans]NIJ32774.1 hypothetical protein [Sphingomonas oligoaromativorans]